MQWEIPLITVIKTTLFYCANKLFVIKSSMIVWKGQNRQKRKSTNSINVNWDMFMR